MVESNCNRFSGSPWAVGISGSVAEWVVGAAAGRAADWGAGAAAGSSSR